jgi:hypothetical protein
VVLPTMHRVILPHAQDVPAGMKSGQAPAAAAAKQATDQQEVLQQEAQRRMPRRLLQAGVPSMPSPNDPFMFGE